MSKAKDQLVSRLAAKQAIIGVLGLGYVGLPLALRFAEAGFKTVGFDIDADKIASLHARNDSRQDGESPACRE